MDMPAMRAGTRTRGGQWLITTHIFHTCDGALDLESTVIDPGKGRRIRPLRRPWLLNHFQQVGLGRHT